MDWQQLIIALLIGATAGIFGGLFGIGGAIIMIPALIFFLGFQQNMAQGTTLLMFSIPVGAIAAYNYYKVDQVNVPVALFMAIGFIIASFFASKWANQLSGEWPRRLFAILLLLIGAKMLFIDKSEKEDKKANCNISNSSNS